MGKYHSSFSPLKESMRKIALVFVTILAGAAVSQTFQPPLFQTLPYDAALVVIDGKAFTKRDALRDAKTFMALTKNKQRRKKMDGTDLNFVRRYCKNVVQQHVLEAAIERYAQKNNLAPNQEQIDKSVYQITRQFGVRSKKFHRWHTLDDLKWILGPKGPRLDQEVRMRALYHLVTNHMVVSAKIEVTPQMVSNRLDLIARVNSRAQATNEHVYAHASNVWRTVISKKMTFEQAATNYTEDVCFDDFNGCEWGSFGLDQIADDPQVLALLPILKEGSITPPVESDNGLAILRLDSKDDKTYTFSRIFFRLPMFRESETPAEAAANVRDLETEKCIQRAFADIKSGLKIEYPNGTNFFDKACAPFRLVTEDLRE